MQNAFSIDAGHQQHIHSNKSEMEAYALYGACHQFQHSDQSTKFFSGPSLQHLYNNEQKIQLQNILSYGYKCLKKGLINFGVGGQLHHCVWTDCYYGFVGPSKSFINNTHT